MLNFAFIAVKYSHMHLKDFKYVKIKALRANKDNFDAHINLPFSLQEDFRWWLKHIRGSSNSKRDFNFAIEIFSDSSLTGWGAHSGGSSKHGFWNSEERKLHINILEVKAALFALRCFASKLKDSDILLRTDNQTAISYLNRMGGTYVRKLNEEAEKLWKWCEKRNL